MVKKLMNDPIYGLINIPNELILKLIDHPYFQRLRHINQLGLTELVYPGARHNRFHHAIGAMHLGTLALAILKSKDFEITEQDELDLFSALLLHDIGHGPFSHLLERVLINFHHEHLSLRIVQALNFEFDNALNGAILILTKTHTKPFLNSLVSGQLDLDRMDYLVRDSYYTGVAEGKIGYDRIIKMMSLQNGHLVVEQKGIYSIEKFLIARRLMYWQVYLHKTVLSLEQMMLHCILRAKEIFANSKVDLDVSNNLSFFLKNEATELDEKALMHFLSIDDHDIWLAIKFFTNSKDRILSYLAKCILNRKVFKIKIANEPFLEEEIEKYILITKEKLSISLIEAKQLVFTGVENNEIYNKSNDEIMILSKNDQSYPFSKSVGYPFWNESISKYYLIYPRI